MLSKTNCGGVADYHNIEIQCRIDYSDRRVNTLNGTDVVHTDQMAQKHLIEGADYFVGNPVEARTKFGRRFGRSAGTSTPTKASDCRNDYYKVKCSDFCPFFGQTREEVCVRPFFREPSQQV